MAANIIFTASEAGAYLYSVGIYYIFKYKSRNAQRG